MVLEAVSPGSSSRHESRLSQDHQDGRSKLSQNSLLPPIRSCREEGLIDAVGFSEGYTSACGQVIQEIAISTYCSGARSPEMGALGCQSFRHQNMVHCDKDSPFQKFSLGGQMQELLLKTQTEFGGFKAAALIRRRVEKLDQVVTVQT